jgi:hypothetical protein
MLYLLCTPNPPGQCLYYANQCKLLEALIIHFIADISAQGHPKAAPRKNCPQMELRHLSRRR